MPSRVDSLLDKEVIIIFSTYGLETDHPCDWLVRVN